MPKPVVHFRWFSLHTYSKLNLYVCTSNTLCCCMYACIAVPTVLYLRKSSPFHREWKHKVNIIHSKSINWYFIHVGYTFLRMAGFLHHCVSSFPNYCWNKNWIILKMFLEMLVKWGLPRTFLPTTAKSIWVTSMSVSPNHLFLGFSIY